MASLGEELPKLIAEVRDEIMPAMQEIGPPGALCVAMMKASMDYAINALAEGDVIKCIRAYKDLKGYTT